MPGDLTFTIWPGSGDFISTIWPGSGDIIFVPWPVSGDLTILAWLDSCDLRFTIWPGSYVERRPLRGVRQTGCTGGVRQTGSTGGVRQTGPAGGVRQSGSSVCDCDLILDKSTLGAPAASLKLPPLIECGLVPVLSVPRSLACKLAWGPMDGPFSNPRSMVRGLMTFSHFIGGGSTIPSRVNFMRRSWWVSLSASTGSGCEIDDLQSSSTGGSGFRDGATGTSQ